MIATQRLDDNPCRPRHFKPPPCAPIVPQGPAAQWLETCRSRLFVAGVLFVIVFAVVAVRLVYVMVWAHDPADMHLGGEHQVTAPPLARADIVDRNGVLLATTVSAPSLYADPQQLRAADIDPATATRELTAVLPGLDAPRVRADLASTKSFVWLKRLLTPTEQYDVNRLGIPGLDFKQAELRFYPLGNLTAHVVGYCNIDDKGLSGVERGLNSMLTGRQEPLHLSIDARVQYILRDELQKVVDTFTATGAGGIIMNVHTGEIVAMVSLPDFDPNHPAERLPGETLQDYKDRIFNKMTLGDYELGSVLKIFNTAMILDDGVATLTSTFDAIHPIHVGRFTITDYHGKHRMLSVPEVLMYSSNLGSAREALAAGADRQRAFLAKMGLLREPQIELDEVGKPHYPSDWRPVNVMTIAFGHGISVNPLAAITGAAALVNGGVLHQATLVKMPPGSDPPGKRVISEKTSLEMRQLMRLVVLHGTASFGAAPGYVVGGKTGTAEKIVNGRYINGKYVSTFISAFPMNDPQYALLLLVDDPHGTKATHGYATAGWTVVPATAHVIERIAPLLGVKPVDEKDPALVRELTPRSMWGQKIENY